LHIIIIGAGQVGAFLARNLSLEHDIVVIEKDKETAAKLRDSLDVLIIEGDGDNPSVLREAKIEKADIMLAVSGDDKTNIMVSMISDSLGISKIILRIRHPNYLEYPKILNKPHIIIVHPGAIISNKITSLIGSPFAWRTESFAKGKIQMLKLKVEENLPVTDKKLSELGPAKAWIFVAISRKGQIHNRQGLVWYLRLEW